MQGLHIHTESDERLHKQEALLYRLLQDYRVGESLMGPLPVAASALGLRHGGSQYFLSNTLNERPTFDTEPLGSNYIYAVPFYVPDAGSIADRIAIEVTTLAAAYIRLGIYDSDRNCYPRRLLLDAGIVDVSSTGIKAITVRHGLTRGLKWLVALANGAPVVRVVDPRAPGIWTPLGCDPATWTFYSEWLVPFTYAALPANFPTGGYKGEYGPLIMLRFAA